MKKIKKCRKRTKGFTLIELVITITILVILSMISVPVYKNYVYESKRAEGYVLLSTIRDAQLNYFSEYENFLLNAHSSARAGGSDFTVYDTVLGINAKMNKYFTWMRVGEYNWSRSCNTAFTAEVCSKDWGSIQLVYDLIKGATTI